MTVYCGNSKIGFMPCKFLCNIKNGQILKKNRGNTYTTPVCSFSVLIQSSRVHLASRKHMPTKILCYCQCNTIAPCQPCKSSFLLTVKVWWFWKVIWNCLVHPWPSAEHASLLLACLWQKDDRSLHSNRQPSQCEGPHTSLPCQLGD